MADPVLELEERLRGQLPRASFERGPRPADLSFSLERAEDLLPAVGALGLSGLALATLVASDDSETEERDLKVRYVFEPTADASAPARPDLFVTLLVSLPPDRAEVPSISRVLPAANWHEREARDLFGIVPLDHPDPRPLVVHDGWPEGLHPLRKSFDPSTRPPREPAAEFPHLEVEGEGVFEVPVGPIHAGIIEPGHFRFSSVGDTVLNLDARLFYTHRGLEKRAEGLGTTDGFYVAERLCGVCSLSHGLGYCEAAEQIAGVEAPPRAQFIRSIALELERLYNHVGDIGNIGAGASYHYGTSAGLRMKEAVQALCERFTGSRFLRGLLVPGGVRYDIDRELEASIRRTLDATEKALASLMDRIQNNPTVIDRLDGTGLLSLAAAVELGVTGVGARASGVDRDARRDHPHGAFGKKGAPVLRVMTASEGDVHARLSLRAREAAESLGLVRELLAGLPEGSLGDELPDRLPPGRVGIAAVESPRGSAIHWLQSAADGRIHRYHVRSASFANWPALPVAAQSGIIPDFPLINKSFELCYSCTDR